MIKKAVIEVFFNGKNAEKQIQNFSGKVKGMFAGIVGALSVKNVFDKTLKLAEFSEKFRTPVDEASKFANALSILGGSSDEAVDKLEGLEQALIDLRLSKGGGVLGEVSARIGLNLMNANGQLKNSLELVEELRQAMPRLSREGRLDSLSKLGLDSPAIMRYLKLSSEEMQNLKKRAVAMGVVDKQSSNTVIELSKSISELRQSFLALGQTLLKDYAPAVDALTVALRKFAEWVKYLKYVLNPGQALENFFLGGLYKAEDVASGFKGNIKEKTQEIGKEFVISIKEDKGVASSLKSFIKPSEVEKTSAPSFTMIDLIGSKEQVSNYRNDLEKAKQEKEIERKSISNNNVQNRSTINVTLPNVTDVNSFMRDINRVQMQQSRGTI